jgi:hypothetical protein
LAKAAARGKDKAISYNRIPTSTLYTELEEETKRQKILKKFQKQPKKQFFPSISDRLKLKIDVTPNFTAMVTGHGKIRA